MDIFNTTSRKRETYQVEIKYSPLWECSLGIAAITNTSLLDSLEKPASYWREVKETISETLRNHLDYVEENNTWKALLQLLHQEDFSTLEAFTSYIQTLSAEALKFICLPYLGDAHQVLRERAANKDQQAIKQLKELTADNSFFPRYITFISHADTDQLKSHLIAVMTGWYKEVITEELDQLKKILQTDAEAKEYMKEKMHPEEFVEWATFGITYAPEPSVYNVLLIPHVIYRPWNIVADIAGTKIFYYPVANQSIAPNDTYLPSHALIVKHKALGDEVRLRIVKMLSENSHTLQELTDKLAMGKSTIHHHLKMLRSAQLVEIRDAKYALKKKAIDSLTKELDYYLQQ
ncbi:ArsR family transcriptional regulator [Virgibacillus dakarensis]|uniref:Transcriptional regulator n=1 Tax=Lentibacillus populi TaxID=1827502 RepID=A0A9W5X7V9_9BACI|nr:MULTISPECIES: metalloregulator ArsR/SmtB family transcription factor [Bacillaceae]MBT2216446.1 winged helix-turn-helix domain-containing protein [Virgibacillus dakarensis]MTW85858.1 ArsR family transcriptional regulator [Virgibacillus dakarensis]GGB59933.1 transcriptional regulator [Lentibacillus populi]